jgi:hypothetical protein
MIISVAILAATNSDPYDDVSTVFCRFEVHAIGVLLTKRSIPVTERRVTTSWAWSAST